MLRPYLWHSQILRIETNKRRKTATEVSRNLIENTRISSNASKYTIEEMTESVANVTPQKTVSCSTWGWLRLHNSTKLCLNKAKWPCDESMNVKKIFPSTRFQINNFQIRELNRYTRAICVLHPWQRCGAIQWKIFKIALCQIFAYH